MKTLAAIDISSGKPGTIDVSGTPNSPAWIVLDNESPYAIQVGISPAVKWLAPWTTDIFYFTGNVSEVNYTPSILTGTQLVGTQLLLATVGYQGDTIPQGYPVSKNRVTVPNFQAVPLTPTGMTANPTTVTLPPGTQSILVTANNLGCSGVQVKGHTTGQIYAQFLGSPSVTYSALPVNVPNNSEDLQVDVSLLGTITGGPANYQIFAVLTPIAASAFINGGVIDSITQITNPVPLQQVSPIQGLQWTRWGINALPAGSSAAIISPVANKRIGIYGLAWAMNPSATTAGVYQANLYSSATIVFVDSLMGRVLTGSGVSPHMGRTLPIDPERAIFLPLNEGLTLQNNPSASNVDTSGIVLYTLN